MNKLIAGTVAALWLGCGAALAADMNGPAAGAAPSKQDYNWTGAYVGLHVGGGWQSTSFADPGATSIMFNCCFLIGNVNTPGPIPDGSASSVLGGVQAGWMYQIARLVIGAEFDWSATRLKSAGAASFTPIVAGNLSTDAYSERTDWIATSTATVGIARDNWLLFTKAGAAFAEDKYAVNIAGSGTFFGPVIPFSFSSTANKIVPGWTAGGGVRYALGQNLLVSAEYDYIYFGSRTPNLSGAFSATPTGVGTAATFTPNFTQGISEVKLGIDYKFAPGLLFW